MKIFFDTEFIEDGKTIELLSIGMVREDGETLYLENMEADWNRADAWVRENVLPKLTAYAHVPLNLGYEFERWHMDKWDRLKMPHTWLQRDHIATSIKRFVGESPEFWAYYADYDWIVLCQLFGRMVDLPEGWPKYCRDFKQWLDQHEVAGELERLPGDNAHNALADARWLKSEFDRLTHLVLDAPAATTLSCSSRYVVAEDEQGEPLCSIPYDLLDKIIKLRAGG